MSTTPTSAPFGHVLCWVDGSAEACSAAERAALLSKSLGAGLSFLAIGTRPRHSARFDAYARIEGVTAPMPPMVEGDAAACLDTAMAIAARIGVTSAGRLTQIGNAVTAICDAAKSGGADLVVSRKDRAGVVERLLGSSVAGSLTRRCAFAVLSDR